MDKKKFFHMAAFILVIIGGLNWGLFGLFNLDLVESLLGGVPTLAEIVYVLIGVSAVYLAVTHKTDCKTCGTK